MSAKVRRKVFCKPVEHVWKPQTIQVEVVQTKNGYPEYREIIKQSRVIHYCQTCGTKKR